MTSTKLINSLLIFIALGMISFGSILASQTYKYRQGGILTCLPNDEGSVLLHTDSSLTYQTPYTESYDPLAEAIASIGQTVNLEASVPSQCYTKTGGESNPCWTCHTQRQGRNFQGDWDLQEEYAFSDFALKNHWKNLFKDRSTEIAAITDADMIAYINTDNYTPLREALAQVADYPGYRPDLDLYLGFDEAGFARDGSQWRAIRYKPFLGTFWPTNGSTDDVMIRLPQAFRTTVAGAESQEIYKINLAILETAVATPPDIRRADIVRLVEPVNEVLAGIDLNGDGILSSEISTLYGLPDYYVGAANDIVVDRFVYPIGTEFLHTVRYVDINQPSLLSTRLKELRYSKKVKYLDDWAIGRQYEWEFNEKDEGKLPIYSGSPLVGLMNNFGWQLQGFIEDGQGRLRLQTEEEHRFCMGCHTAIGVTVDQTFALARKVPGAEGWQHQYMTGIQDVPQYGHDKPEILTYFERVQGGDEFRANEEILNRFFPNGKLDEAEMLRAAPGGDQDIGYLITPSAERAAQLNKAYMALIKAQEIKLGRDTLIAPPANVHSHISNGSTDLGDSGQIYKDGQLWLDWFTESE